MNLRIVAGLLAAISVLAACGPGWAAAPTLSRVFPPGGKRGSSVIVNCTGEFSWPAMVWAPGIAVIPQAESGRLLLLIPDDLVTDRVWIRLYNAEGASATVPFLIGSLSEVVEQEPNNTIPQAQAQLQEHSAVTLNGVLQESGDVDGCSMRLHAGQTLVAALEANGRLGSPMDAVIQIASSDGIVVAENHDDVGLDPRAAFTAPVDGIWTARVFAFPSAPDTNIGFRGGADYVYRLTLTTGPVITHTIPSVTSLENPGTVEVAGWNITPGTRLQVQRPGGPYLSAYEERELTGDQRNSAESHVGIAFNPDFPDSARVRMVPHPVQPELIQATPPTSVSLLPPTALTGWLSQPRQSDLYRLPLQKDQVVVIAVESRGLNLPLHPVVRLTAPDGTAAAAAEPAEPQDVVLVHTATQNGDYQLSVTDRYRLGGDRCLYRLSVRLEEADFEISAPADVLVIPHDKPAELELTVQRRTAPGGTPGAVTITVPDLPPGVTASTVVSEPGTPTADKVKLVFSAGGAAFSGPIHIAGTADIRPGVRRFARTPGRFGVCHEYLWLTALAAPQSPKP